MTPARDYPALVRRWLDGDTCEASVDLGFGLTLTALFRLAGINTPERGQAGAEEARAFCAERASGAVLLRVGRQDKYGRHLAEVLVGGTTLTALLIGAGLGKEYHGERRP